MSDRTRRRARRLLNDLDAYRAIGDRKELDVEMVAHEWVVPAFITWQQQIMWWAPRPLKRLRARFGVSD